MIRQLGNITRDLKLRVSHQDLVIDRTRWNAIVREDKTLKGLWLRLNEYVNKLYPNNDSRTSNVTDLHLYPSYIIII